MGSPTRYFDIFGLKPSFSLDKHDLKERYFEISKRAHPDKPGQPLLEGVSIEEINKAYDVLRNDLTRARYLSNVKKFDVDKQFLMGILDHEEEISSATSDEEIKNIRDDLQKKIDHCKRHISGESLAKWGYYERLMKMLNKKKENK
ncbi:hypothetical protein KMI_06g10330 [Encephalitozoon hellem]|nr:hypothetical protein KMI_06g10330 [Encephalitozoon hellem]